MKTQEKRFKVHSIVAGEGGFVVVTRLLRGTGVYSHSCIVH